MKSTRSRPGVNPERPGADPRNRPGTDRESIRSRPRVDPESTRS
jgi:hypothetical protein